jgi:hypothetical protein
MAVFQGGAYHGHGFELDDQLAAEVRAGWRTQHATLVLEGPALEPTISTRQGLRLHDRGAVAVYTFDEDMTARHGVVFTDAGRRVRVLVFSFDRPWTDQIRPDA